MHTVDKCLRLEVNYLAHVGLPNSTDNEKHKLAIYIYIYIFPYECSILNMRGTLRLQNVHRMERTYQAIMNFSIESATADNG